MHPAVGSSTASRWVAARPVPLVRQISLCLVGLLTLGILSSCHHNGPTSDEGKIKLAFESCKKALISQQIQQALVYFPHNVNDYLNRLNSGVKAPPVPPAGSPADPSPVVTQLLRTALEKKVPADLRANLTLDALLQRIADKHLLNLHDVEEIKLGRISIEGPTAYAQIYYQGSLTALRLPFIKEDNVWKIDVMAVLPSAELLMRLDRAIKGESENEQVEQLVNKLPSL